MKKNRNLSSVIDSIQDEGPSSSATEGSITETGPVDGPLAPGDGVRPSALWVIFIGLLAGLVVAGIFLLGAGGFGGYFSAASRTAITTPADVSRAIDSRLQEFQERQVQLGRQIDQLTAAVAENKTTLNQWLAQQAIQPDARSDRQDNSSAAHPLVTGQQELSSVRDKETGEAMIAKPGAVPVPDDAMNEASVIAPLAVSVLQPAASEAQSAKVDTVSSLQVEENEAAMAPPEPIPAANVPVDGKAESVPEPQAKVSETAVSKPATSGDAGEPGWVINVAYSEKQKTILGLMKKMGDAGIITEQQNVRVKGKAAYTLRITGFSSIGDARDFIKNRLDGKFGLRGPWVSRGK